MKKLLIILLAILLMTVSVFAQEDTTNDICDYIGSFVTVDIEVPSYIPFKNEQLNIYTFDETPVTGIITSDGIVTAISCDEITGATFTIHVKDKQTIQDIINSESPADTIKQKLKDDAITVKGLSGGKKIKMFFAKIGISIASWFS